MAIRLAVGKITCYSARSGNYNETRKKDKNQKLQKRSVIIHCKISTQYYNTGTAESAAFCSM